MSRLQRRAAAPIAVQPFGPVARDQLRLLDRILRDELHASSVILPPRPLPEAARVVERNQLDADRLLDELFAILPERCLRILGVTEADLFVPGRTFVFGYAHLTDGVAIYSLNRLCERFYGRAEDPSRLASRVRRAVVHELGHTFGVPHCEGPTCVLRAVTQVDTLDALVPTYCATCAERVQRGLEVAPWSPRGRRERALSWLRRGEPARARAAMGRGDF